MVLSALPRRTSSSIRKGFQPSRASCQAVARNRRVSPSRAGNHCDSAERMFHRLSLNGNLIFPVVPEADAERVCGGGLWF